MQNHVQLFAFFNTVNFQIINAHTLNAIFLFGDENERRLREVGVSNDADLY